MRQFDEPRSQIRSILLNDWDPHNAIRAEAAHGTYDQYVDPLYDLLKTGAGEDAVMEWLHEREKETMCFPSLGVERLRRVARLLIGTVS
ncbi:MAG TPA: hypothetical protein VEA69_10040 [Tepidisphaeraceae bacterium]|nr:hypothetical protein [Tepidisphaeraceae bacterium]